MGLQGLKGIKFDFVSVQKTNPLVPTPYIYQKLPKHSEAFSPLKAPSFRIFLRWGMRPF